MSFRTNRTHLKDDFFAVGALKKGTSGREGAQAMAKLKCSFWLKKLLG